MPVVGIVVEVGAAFSTQPRAVIPAQGLEWQIKHHLVTEQRLEVDEVALQPASEVIVQLDPWVDVQLLDIDLHLVGDLARHRTHSPRTLTVALPQIALLDHRLESKFELDR
jgi:hypothetical protein